MAKSPKKGATAKSSKSGASASNTPTSILIPAADTPVSRTRNLPGVLQQASRSGEESTDELINHRVVQVEQVFDLSAQKSRSHGSENKARLILGDGDTDEDKQQLLVLEAEDGTTLFLSPEALEERLRSLAAERSDADKRDASLLADGELDLGLLRDSTAESRGMSDWIWSKLSVLSLTPDSLVAAAKDKAQEYLEDKLGDMATEKLGDLVTPEASWIGAKCLMSVIESRLSGEPGLYRWHTMELRENDRVDAGKEKNAPYEKLQKAVKDKKPILVFIHGTASHTLGSFGDLRSGDDDSWDRLYRQFGEHIYGFEHRTFSQSPIDNALELAEQLPEGANITLVTHSRGGLVGDLLCLATLQDAEIKRYQRPPPREADGGPSKESDEARSLREHIYKEEQQQLCQLRDLLAEKQFNIRRYVRVACPAAGTSILSESLDVFCSSLLTLLNIALSAIPGVETVGGNMLSVVRRIVLEIVQKRIDPQLVPGLEAMLPDSPLTGLLAQASRRENIEMAILAGDADGGRMLKRIVTLFANWVIFDDFDHDLVVDTQSMRGGIARRDSCSEFFVRGGNVSHFHYFAREETRTAVLNWIEDDKPQELPGFSTLPNDCSYLKESVWEAPEQSARDARADIRPILFYLPGLMGSHLELHAFDARDPHPGDGNRIWFDPTDLISGGLSQLELKDEATKPANSKSRKNGDKKGNNIQPEGIFKRYYGNLADHLEQHFQVIPFPYDWRDDLNLAADDLAQKIQEKLEKHPKRPISILAHSMGGLVARLMIAKNDKLWNDMVSRPGCRFVMLGTPNNGSHLVVESLLAKSSTIRTLARFDFRHDMSELLRIVSSFKGMLQLLPRPGFVDTGMTEKGQDKPPPFKYFTATGWKDAGKKNRDRWFGNKQVAQPTTDALKAAANLWKQLEAQSQGGIPHSEKVAYVFGSDQHTPCGLEEHRGEWRLIGTQQGDGSVTWDSGRLPKLDNVWYMPADHSGLTRNKRYFSAISDILQTGKTSQLSQQPSASRSSRTLYPYEAGPVIRPGPDELEKAIFGRGLELDRNRDTTQILDVSVHAMDLRFTQHPILCGHYISDVISGTEALIDKHLVDGALTQRERLGVYACDIGTSTIVLKKPSQAERNRGTRHGAIIVGLGEWNDISSQRISQTVRDGVLRYLLCHAEHEDEAKENGEQEEPKPLILSSLLIGYNSTTHISVDASIDAVVRGVCEANQQFSGIGKNHAQTIRELRFVEFYLDTAITAAYAVRELPTRLEQDLERLQTRVNPAPELRFHAEKPRQRLNDHSAGDYWPRLMVTDADSKKTKERAEKALKKFREEHANDPFAARPSAVAEKLKYVFLSERARAEAIEQIRQPGLVEKLIRKQITRPDHDKEICRTLFQLMIPLDFKLAARQTESLLLILDEYTANLPWEMLQADDEPLATKMAMVRQFVADDFRRNVRSSISNTACVIGNPSTAGFFKHYMNERDEENPERGLASLPGATDEAKAAQKTLSRTGYTVESLYPSSADTEPHHSAIEVFNVLFRKPYRILMIAAHGVTGMVNKEDGLERTGVVLSDGVMITAAEIGQMEVVPDLVFLNCCHIGNMENSEQAHDTSYNRLAYSISRELIQMGVRCIIAAGWAVNDHAAKVFSTEFFKHFVEKNQPFGKAVFQARKRVHQDFPRSNTWGAYQAYGDPTYVMNNSEGQGRHHKPRAPVAPQELLTRFEELRINHCHQYMDETLSVAELKDKITGYLKMAPDEWFNRPDVQYKLGHLYAEWGFDAYEPALEAYRKAVRADSKDGNVPIAAFEQIANLEVRRIATLSSRCLLRFEELGEQSLEKWDTPRKRESYQQDLLQYQLWLETIDHEVARLDSLFALEHASKEMSEADTCQPERNALIGSSLKRKAQVLVDLKTLLDLKIKIEKEQKVPSPKVLADYLLKKDYDKKLGALRNMINRDRLEETLKKSAMAYKRGENLSFSGEFNPYPLLNRLQIECLLGEQDQGNYKTLVHQAQEIAYKKFNQSHDFFDAVMPVDAEVVLFLAEPGGDESEQGDKAPVTRLVDAYQEAMRKVPRSSRQASSVVEQLRLLASFAEFLDDGKTRRARILEKVADVLQNDSQQAARK